MTQTEKELLRAQDISFSYGERQVLWDISFSVESGQYVSLIGPNGSGKSTLFEILCGNRRAQEGNAYYKGRDIYEMDIRGRARHLAVIHQNEGISFPYTCMEMVLLGLHPHRARSVSYTHLDVYKRQYLIRTKELIRTQRKGLKEGIASLGWQVYGSKANFVFFRAPGQGNLKARLEEKGILIRGCGNYPGLDESYYRVAVRSPRENQMLLAALKEQAQN